MMAINPVQDQIVVITPSGAFNQRVNAGNGLFVTSDRACDYEWSGESTVAP